MTNQSHTQCSCKEFGYIGSHSQSHTNIDSISSTFVGDLNEQKVPDNAAVFGSVSALFGLYIVFALYLHKKDNADSLQVILENV